MADVKTRIADYLTCYEVDGKRYGGAFGIIGAHGSGKRTS